MFNPVKWFDSLPESKQFDIRIRIYLALEIVMLWAMLTQIIAYKKLYTEYQWLQQHCTQTDVLKR